MLLCSECDAANTSRQYHCPTHCSLAGCFYRFLEPFTVDELQRHETALGKLLDAADTKSKRKTLRKQLERVRDRLEQQRHALADAALLVGLGRLVERLVEDEVERGERVLVHGIDNA